MLPVVVPAQRNFTFKIHNIKYRPTFVREYSKQGFTSKIALYAEKNGQNYSEASGQTNAIARKLLQKEEELKFITSPGRLPPKASVIASLRKEIAHLRDQLNGKSPDCGISEKEESDEPKTPDPIKKQTTNSTSKMMVSSQGVRASDTVLRKTLPVSGGRKALLLVEQQLSNEDTSVLSKGVSSMNVSEKVKAALQMVEENATILEASRESELNEYETLQVENAVLRAKLENLVQEKRRLEHMKVIHARLHASSKNLKKKDVVLVS